MGRGEGVRDIELTVENIVGLIGNFGNRPDMRETQNIQRAKIREILIANEQAHTRILELEAALEKLANVQGHHDKIVLLSTLSWVAETARAALGTKEGEG
jgi:hypothetical protein